MRDDKEIIKEIERLDKLIEKQDYLIMPDFKQISTYSSRLDTLIPFVAGDIKVTTSLQTIITKAMIFSPYSLAVKLLRVAIKALFAKGVKEAKTLSDLPTIGGVIATRSRLSSGRSAAASNDDRKMEIIEEIMKVFAEQANHSTFSDEVRKIFESQNITVAELERRSNIEYSYLHKLIYNKLKPNATISRDLAIKLCLALILNLNESNELITKAGYILCGNTERDRILSLCIDNRVGVRLTNEILQNRKLPLLDKEKKQRTAEA